MNRAPSLPALAAIACIACLPLPAEVRILSVEFDPPLYVSGELTRAYVAWDDAGVAWSPTVREDGFPEPSPTGPVIRSATLATRSGRAVLSVEFTPWRPGPGTLPPLSVGGVSFPPIPLETASALAGHEGWVPSPLPQLEPEGQRTRVYLLVAALLALAALAGFASLRLMPWLRLLLGRWTFARARREFDALLDYLLEADRDGPDAWALLCSGLRRYLGTRSGANIQALTPGELRSLAPGALPEGAAGEAAAILERGDRIRFAGEAGGGLAAALAAARPLADRVEEALRQPASGTAAGRGSP